MVTELFNHFDNDQDGLLNETEFNQLLQEVFKAASGIVDELAAYI